MQPAHQAVAGPGDSLRQEQIDSLLDVFVAHRDFLAKRVLLIVPDGTRTAPIGALFRGIHRRLDGYAECCDVIIALGTHPPLSDDAICGRLEITQAERGSTYRNVQIFNHTWDQAETLERLGIIPGAEIRELTAGLFEEDVPVEINRAVNDYDVLMVIGPVFPHEVVGFSGGNKYFFPGISGPALLNFFHWVGALVTNPMIIGNKWTPVRRIVDRAASYIRQERLCLAAVVEGSRFAGLFAGDPVSAWDAASDLSAQLHIIRKPHPFHTVLSCAPPMYEELWVAGKCMYKLEPVVADGGELIIYAPHVRRISEVHGHLIREIGYHCRDYFVKQWERFRHHPWGVLAHSTHVRGIGTYDAESGTEHPRIRVTLATGISREECARINLEYRDPATIDTNAFADRENDGILRVPRAGETLYQLWQKPAWAGGA
jgi:nickel-dependent lactate racemase